MQKQKRKTYLFWKVYNRIGIITFFFWKKHDKLVDDMLDVADKNLTEEIIKEFHKILKEGTMDNRKEWFNVGEYKKLANEAGTMQTSSPKQTPKDRQKLMEWYKSLIEVKIKDIIEFHSRFEEYVHFKMVMVEYQNKTEKGYLIDTCLKAQD